MLADAMGSTRSLAFRIRAHQAGTSVARSDDVTTEEPLEIRVDGRSLAVVMRTPGEDEELAVGFLHAESILSEAAAIQEVKRCPDVHVDDYDNIIDVILGPEHQRRADVLLRERLAERSIVTSSSCGICGKATIEAIHQTVAPLEHPLHPRAELITALPDKLRDVQSVFDRTGGLHAAGMFDSNGGTIVVREDVGRHNAVDKCVGNRVLAGGRADDLILAVSGRVSFEIVQKALLFGVSVVVAISAPTSLAIELARLSNMTLCGFTRGENFNLYAGEVSQ